MSGMMSRTLYTIVLWCRWHHYHGTSALPTNKDKEHDAVYALVKDRLIRAARRVHAAENRWQRQNELLHAQIRHGWNNNCYDSEFNQLSKSQEEYKRKYLVALQHYCGLWAVSQDAGVVKEIWGDQEKFLQAYGFPQKVHHHKSFLMQTL